MDANTISTKMHTLTRLARRVGILLVILALAGLPLMTSHVLAQSPRIYAQYTDDHIRFEYSPPGAEVTFSIYESQGGTLLWEESRTADEEGFAAVSIWEHRTELWPEMFIVVSDGSTTKELLLEPLSIDVYDPDENILAGTAGAGREVWIVANNDPEFCGKVVTADANGDWSYDFDDQGCDVIAGMDAYAQVMDGEEDTTEVFLDFIDGWHDYDQGDVPHWACNAGGWAVDTDDRERDLDIRILADGMEVTSTTASNPTDLQGICGTDGSCGYEVSLWGLISAYEEHQITVQAYDLETDQWLDLNGTPKPLTCRTYDIYTYDRLTGETRQITFLTDSYEFNPRWSQDGKQIVHDRWDLDFSTHGVYITDVESGVSTALAGAESGSYPAWSPNGQWIAFDYGSGEDFDEDFRVFIIPPSGGEPMLVRENAFMASWAPNSQRLAFHQPSDGSIWTMDLQGENGALVVERGNGPAWSPNGQWIAYEVDGDLWKVRVDIHGNPLGEPIQLTSEPGYEGRPSWSNNSQTIVFHKGFDRDTDIWMIPAMGGTATWLTGAPDFADYDPNFSNNGRYVAYASYSPAGQAARSWVAAFTADLPAGALAEGTYPYHFEFEWSLPEPGEFSGQGGEFLVSSEAPPYDGYVLLRGPLELRGVDTPDGLICEEVGELNPDQPARFLIGWLTDQAITYPEALAHFNSISASAIWGEGTSEPLAGHELIPFYPSTDWFQYVCSYTRKTDLSAQSYLLETWDFLTGGELFLPMVISANR